MDVSFFFPPCGILFGTVLGRAAGKIGVEKRASRRVKDERPRARSLAVLGLTQNKNIDKGQKRGAKKSVIL